MVGQRVKRKVEKQIAIGSQRGLEQPVASVAVILLTTERFQRRDVYDSIWAFRMMVRTIINYKFKQEIIDVY